MSTSDTNPTSTTPVKILITGPVFSGKTTLVQTLSETDVVETDEIATEDIGKATTTIALDFGSLTIDGHNVYLFGTPGQDRFDFIWNELSKGSLGMMLMVAADKSYDYPYARKILKTISSQHPMPFVLGVTRLDVEDAWSLERVAEYFLLDVDDVVGLDARDEESAKAALRELLERVDTAR